MQELELIGVDEDGKHLLLRDSADNSYVLPLSDKLKSVLTGATVTSLGLHPQKPTILSPRDIQARLRLGFTSTEVAQSTGMDLHVIQRYEGPILAERENCAKMAQSFAIGRGGPTLSEKVGRTLHELGHAGAVRWDAWRKEDNQWTLKLECLNALEQVEITAHFVVDLRRQFVIPQDETARLLLDVAPPAADFTPLQGASSAGFVADAQASGQGATPGAETADGATIVAFNQRKDAATGAGSANGSVPFSERDKHDTTPLPTEQLPPATTASDAAATILNLGPATQASTESAPLEGAEEPLPIALTSTPPLDIAEVEELHSSPAIGKSAHDLLLPRSSENATKETSTLRGKPRPRRTSIPPWDDILFPQQKDEELPRVD